MNQKLQNISNIIRQSEKLDKEQKEILLKAIKDVDKELEITAFKLERTEKVKKTTAILLEETIEELEQKRKAVEEHNRELEIESSLERVRAVAMSMSRSEDLLNICEASFKEFKKLDFNNIRNAIIHIPNDEQKYFMDYDYSEFTGGAITKIEYGSHPIVDEYLEKIRSAEDAYFEVVITKDQLSGWKDFRKKSGQQDDPRLEDSTALYYYLFSIGIGDIGISTFNQIDESQIKILKRFRNVFDLAYRRYNDIALAEAQAREAEIQLALERVRARAIAMHKSDELLEAGELLYREITRLGIVCLTSGYVLIDEKENIGWNYAASPKDGKIMSVPVGIPHLETEVMCTVTTSWKKGEPYSIIQLDPEATIKHQTFIAERSTNFPLTAKELIAISPEQVVLHNFNFKHGYLLIVGGVLLTAEQIDMMVRFSKVFEMTYRRFLDLQKAEAQAREAQIEAALEKVRSRTMAMHQSYELADSA
ncbi:MAG TPA: hypothetical protein VF870_15930, partial [Ignavibacteriaceae bacterium]